MLAAIDIGIEERRLLGRLAWLAARTMRVHSTSPPLRHPESAARAFHPYTQPRSVYSPGPLVSTAARIIRFAVAGNPGQASISRAKSTSFCVSRG